MDLLPPDTTLDVRHRDTTVALLPAATTGVNSATRKMLVLAPVEGPPLSLTCTPKVPLVNSSA